MKKNVLVALIAITMVATLVPTASFATESIDAQDETEVLTVDDDVADDIKCLEKATSIDNDVLETMEDVGDVEVEIIDDDSLVINVKSDNPIKTEILNGESWEIFEDVELLVENSNSMDIEECAEIIADETDGEVIEENDLVSKTQDFKSLFLPDVCYANEYNTYTKTLGKVKATVGFSYKRSGWFYKPIYSRVKLSKKESCSIKQLQIKSKEIAGYTYKKPKKSGTSKRCVTTEEYINASPKTGTWYYCYFDNKDRWAWSNFSVGCDTYVKVKYGSSTKKSFTRCRTFFQGSLKYEYDN